jgi:hypothetical protein
VAQVAVAVGVWRADVAAVAVWQWMSGSGWVVVGTAVVLVLE